MITVEEVEDLNIKLLSDKAKIREEGCKELNVYLETTGPHGLCALLDKETMKLQDEDRITSSTWPGVLHALCQCVAIESKKKAPKPVFAKTLRMFIYKAEDNHRTGGNLFLLRKVKRLFQHIYDTLRDVPSFLLDYGQILCQLLPIPEYRLRISKKVYGDLVLLFLKKAKFIARGTAPELGTAKEEAFRSTLTLLCLLQYPPGDFPDFLRTDTATGFVDIFLHLRDEGRIAKKLLASLNVLLFNDGPNLGDLLVDIHSSVRKFMVRTWITTRDRELKESLVLYLRCQLKLRKIIRQDDGTFLQELWELVEKDLEQGNLLLVGSHRYDGREEKSGTLTRGLRSFLKLVAAILYEVLTRHEARPLPQAKRRKKEDINTRLRDGIASAKCLWLGSLCLLMREHGGEISRAMLVDFLNGLSSSLERVFSEGLKNRSFDALVWTLRCLQELSIIWPTGIGDKGGVQNFHADGIAWQLVWDFMLRWLSVINTVPIVLDEMLRLLGHLILKDIVRSCNVPHMVWELQYFSDRPSRSGLYFVGAVSVTHENQMGVLSNLELRKRLLTWSLGTLEYEDGGRAKCNNGRVAPTMFSSLVMILAIGSMCIQHLVGASETFIESMMEELGDWSEAEDQEKFQESDLLLLDHSENLLASCGNMGMSKRFKVPLRLNNSVAADSDILLRALADCLIASVSKLMHGSQEQLLPRILYLAVVISHCICGVNGLVQNRTAPLSDWSEGGVVWQNLALALQHCKSNFENVLQSFDNDDNQMSVSSTLSQIPPSISLMSEFVATPCNCILITEESKASTTKASILESLLYTLSNLISSPGVARELHQNSNCLLATPSSRNINESISLIDVDLDAEVESLSIHVSAAAESFDSFLSATSTKNDSWKVSCVSMVVVMAKCLPEATFNVLSSLLLGNHDKEVHNELVLGACNAICDSTLHHLPKIVELIVQISEDCLNPEASYSQVLDAISTLLSSISKVNGCKSTLQGYDDLVKLIERMANMGLSIWHTRIKLADAISKFIVVDPGAAQVLTEKLLSLLHDPEFRVRLGVACKVPLLFDTWNGHEDLLQDICSNVGTKLPMATKLKTISAAEVCQPGAAQGTFADTALITLGQVAISSEYAESEAVFMICAAAALYPGQRCLVAAVLDMLAKHLGYATRGKYLEQLLAGVLSRWVTAAMPLPALVEIRDIIAGKLDSKEFLTSCTPFLIPNLLLNTRDDELQWLARATSKSVSSLLRENFTTIFSALLPLHCCGCPRDQDKASTVLQGSMLSCTGMSEDERDSLIERHMVSIVGGLFQLCSGDDMPEKPFFPKDAVITSVRTVVDGFLEVDQLSEDGGVIDKMQVFRADRIFQLLLQMHHQIDAACHPRHRHHCLSRLGAILTVVHKRAIVPSTSRYFIHIVLQSIEVPELQDLCCSLLSDLMRKLEQYSSGTFVWVLGNQLQSIVSRLVSCCIDEACDSDCGMSSVVDRPIAGKIRKSQQRHMKRPSSAVLSLLHSITVGAHPSLHPYIQNLDPFPEYQPFEPMKKLQAELCSGRTLEDEFVQFVQRAPQLPPQLRLRSLQRICDQLRNRKSDMLSYKDGDVRDGWQNSAKVGEAVWKLVKFCDEQDDYDMRDLTGELLATVGIANADEVVFHLPGESKISGLLTAYFGHSVDNVEGGLSDDVVKAILLQLNGFLLDNSVSIIELASRSIKGVLSTEKGYRVLNLLDAQEKAYLEIHAKGINLRVVEDMVNKIREDSSKKTTGLDDPLLWDTSGKTYEAWICSLVNTLVERTEDSILRLCQPLVLSKVGLAELVLPHTLACLLSRSSKDTQIFKAISSQVEKTVFAESNKSTRSIQIFLEAMNCLRRSYVLNKMNPPALPSRRQENLKGAGTRQSNGGSENVDMLRTQNLQTELAWPKVYWLDIDYLVVAKAAQQCAAFFTSILYLEHWCEEKFGKLALGQLDFCNNLDSKLPVHMELLLHAYSEINEPDGLYGVLQSHKLISQLRMHEHEGNWDKALGCYDLLLGMPANCENKSLVTQYHIGILRSLRQIGCCHVQAMYWNGLIDQDKHLINDSEFKELQYEAAWRAGTWDFKGSRADMSIQDLGINYHENLHSCLKSLAEGSAEVFHSQIKKVKQDLVSHIINTSMESTRNVHPQIVKLQIIDCLSQAWGIRWSSQASSYDHIPMVPSHAKMKFFYETWQEMVKQTRTNFDLYEPFATFLCVLYKLLGQSDFLHQQLLQLASFSRKAGKLNQAAAAVHELKQIYEGSTAENAIAVRVPEVSNSAMVEEAKLLWAQEQQEMAVNLIKYILQLKTGSCSDTVYCLAGKWLAKTRSATSKTILESYFKRAVEMAEADPKNMILSRKRICKSHFHLAHYADSLYKSYEDRFSSSEWQSALRLRHLKSKELEALARRLKMATKDDKRDYAMKIVELQKQIALDAEEENRLQNDKEYFLKVALQGYRCCLMSGDKYDIRVVFRLVSLWFNLTMNPRVVEDMFLTVEKVQSFKFLPLVYQIASRMGTPKEKKHYDFQYVVTSLVKKMAIEHPFHSLYQVFALSNGDRIKDKQRSKSAFVFDLDKKHAAEGIIKELSSHYPVLLEQIKQMIEIYIKLAELETDKQDINKRLTIPRDIRSIRQLELVPVITANIPIDPSCQYMQGTFPYFKGMSDKISVMNGVNAPKVIECLGSDGNKYRQLAKSGNDDLRQDAVMEQLFCLVNALLVDHPDTRRRHLRIRTYKVIPFTPSAGVLEWVDGTVPLGEYLLGSSRTGGAHGRYGIGDWTYMKCREQMTTEKDKRKAYHNVCQNFRPVMHYFFLEKFSQPADWFEKRLAYTRSVAASSMVGYIIGLGDRHSMNILIDQVTAEVVHIDLGVAFEQGLMLKTPERVPFRLTRDIIDGMGISGVEGVFRRCCEETLTVMRSNKEALLTIVEVFIHDPLYKWALSPLKALQRQKETEDVDEDSSELGSSDDNMEGNKDATRAQMRVKQKLDGYEDGELRSLKGQVQQLLQDAQDPERLSQMFPGWGAWL